MFYKLIRNFMKLASLCRISFRPFTEESLTFYSLKSICDRPLSASM